MNLTQIIIVETETVENRSSKLETKGYVEKAMED
jgi:hypothetical protein